MKKLLVILPIILILSSCSSKPAEIQREFKAAVSSEYNDVDIQADVTSKNHTLTIEMKTPESLNGYTYKYDNSKTSVIYDGLMISADDDYFPKDSFSSILNNVLKVTASEEINYSGKYDEKAKYSGKCESGDFVIICDYNTGYISKMEIKKLDFEANFVIK